MEKLRVILKGNAGFSALSGVVLLIGAATWEGFLGLEGWFLAVTGASLVAYGGLLRWLAGRADVVVGARFATIMDAGWVLGAAVVLLAFPAAMSAIGRASLLAVSLVVAAFAEAQFSGLRAAATGRVGPDARHS